MCRKQDASLAKCENNVNILFIHPSKFYFSSVCPFKWVSYLPYGFLLHGYKICLRFWFNSLFLDSVLVFKQVLRVGALKCNFPPFLQIMLNRPTDQPSRRRQTDRLSHREVALLTTWNWGRGIIVSNKKVLNLYKYKNIMHFLVRKITNCQQTSDNNHYENVWTK